MADFENGVSIKMAFFDHLVNSNDKYALLHEFIQDLAVDDRLDYSSDHGF